MMHSKYIVDPLGMAVKVSYGYQSSSTTTAFVTGVASKQAERLSLFQIEQLHHFGGKNPHASNLPRLDLSISAYDTFVCTHTHKNIFLLEFVLTVFVPSPMVFSQNSEPLLMKNTYSTFKSMHGR